MPTRLDQALADRGLVASRSRARDVILRGLVEVNGDIVRKPSVSVSADSRIALRNGAHNLVSRGGEKLAWALDRFGLNVTGRVGLDVGASTGGFTQVLLNAGAARVYAVDVGHGQLHATLRNDPRVIAMDGVDARHLLPSHVAHPIDVIVADVSFISLTKALGPALTLSANACRFVGLVKPQFEAGPAHVGKGGIVRDETIHRAVLKDVAGWVDQQPGWRVRDTSPSPIHGGDGNREFLLYAVRDHYAMTGQTGD